MVDVVLGLQNVFEPANGGGEVYGSSALGYNDGVVGDARVDKPSLDSIHSLICRLEQPDNLLSTIVLSKIGRFWVRANVESLACTDLPCSYLALTRP